MIAYKIKSLNGHLMFERPIKIRHSDKDSTRHNKIRKLINRKHKYWLG